MAHIRLGELLVKAGHLSEEGLARALDEQKKWGGRLGRILREMNLVPDEVLLKALTKQLGLPRAELSAPDVPQSILAKIDARFAVENRLCPERYDAESRTLLVAMEDHLNLGAVDQIGSKTGVRVKTSLATTAEIDGGLAKLYPSDPAVMPAKAPEQGRGMAMFETKDFGQAAAEAREASAPRGVRMLETADFSEAASTVKEESKSSPRMKLFTTDDFSDAAKKIRGDEED
jgi:hypothetical protein